MECSLSDTEFDDMRDEYLETGNQDVRQLVYTVDSLRSDIADLKADLAKFRALAKRASSFAVGIAPDNLGTAVKAILDELAALHKEAADG